MPIPTRTQLLEFAEQIARLALPSESASGTGPWPELAESDEMVGLILKARELTGVEPMLEQLRVDTVHTEQLDREAAAEIHKLPAGWRTEKQTDGGL